MMKIWRGLVGVALYCVGIFAIASALPGGAPEGACANLMPQMSHVADNTMEQTSPNPWMVDVSDFEQLSNGTYTYTPGYTYNVTLRRASNTSTVTLRGLFIQGRTVLTNMMIGAFDNPEGSVPNTRLSSCSTPTVGVTHNNPRPTMDLSGPFTFEWTAPAANTGPVRFRYTIVQTVRVWWANDPSAVVQEVNNIQSIDGGDGGGDGGALQLQGVGQWTLLAVAALAIALKTMLW